jgi:hypothetical protein
MRPDDSYDTRDSSDSRYDSVPPRPPPRKIGLGLAALILATIAVVLEVVGVVVVTWVRLSWIGDGGGGQSGADCMYLCVTVVGVLAVILCTLALSMASAGLGIGGIVRSRGIGRRLGIYALCLAILSFVALAYFIVFFFTQVK